MENNFFKNLIIFIMPKKTFKILQSSYSKSDFFFNNKNIQKNVT